MSEQQGPKGSSFPGENNTGHIWDGNLRELTNPPPKWWLLGLHASWIFVLIYFMAYPSLPLIKSHTKGFLGWTSMKEYQDDLKDIEKIRQPYESRIASMSAAEILQDKTLTAYVQRAGKVLFGDKCAACHGTNGAGNVGFPILADDDWLYGGTVEDIQESITEGRAGNMPAFGSQLSAADISKLAQLVLDWSQGKEAKDPEGQRLFQDSGCIACHGDDGKGNTAVGSANLTDHIWRFQHTKADIEQTITHGVNDDSDPKTRQPTMPTFGGKLSETAIKKLAVFVHELGGGK